jgi:hypothetical protein
MELVRIISSFIELSKPTTPAPKKVAHPGPNSTEISSTDRGTQRNGDNFFLRGEDLSRRILATTHLFQLA